jgi:Protein of unknown function (DUF1579)
MTRVLLILSLISGGTVASAQQPTPEQKKAMQQAMVEKMQPAAEHKTLAALEGKWSIDVLYRMGDGPTMKARGVATNRMILGGRFLESRATSNNPAGPGLDDANVESLTIYGFDRRTGDYTIVGFDTMGTYWVSAAGKMSERKSIVMSGETLDDHAGSKEIRKYDMVLRVVDPDTYVTEIIFKFANRPDLKLVEVMHRRMK